MTESKITGSLTTKRVGHSLFCFERIHSTNDFLKDAAGQLPDGCVAATTEQTAGKGRRGRVWIAPKGETLAVSVLFKEPPAQNMPPVSLVSGLAAAEALGALYGADLAVKWPNDLVLFGKKICGILCEARFTGDGCFTVCGIGVNLTQNPDYFKNAGLVHAASLKMLTGKTFEPEAVCAAVLNRLEEVYDDAASNAQAFLARYEERCVTLGNTIRAETPNGEITGVAETINADGSLCVRCGGKTVTLLSGDVSVRGVMGYV